MRSAPPPPQTPRCDQTAVWQALQQHFQRNGQYFDVRQALRSDAGRFARMALQAPGIRADFSRNWLDEATCALHRI
ncbi:hypothetical protein EBQ26_09105 [Allofranklinella schreckenbergeri]|uniref:Uncharacterized protein n=1 Tax=Allofranklinella schreckenbergeri TaxID=1076744 RepID=A0A3M6Q109_9BURK|nr:hypothetical protein [Allofranklinella schreckenbergeri]RMW96963.1 hypothetical protein EBQ26_09105 [Allofranklinella schreckenbergeri]